MGLPLPKGTWTQNARLSNPKSEGNAALERLRADWRKVELEVRIIRYFRVGCILILLTPVLSLAVLSLLVGVIESLGGEGETLTAWNVSILVLWIIGIALCIYGYVRREATDAEAKVILLFSFFLIP